VERAWRWGRRNPLVAATSAVALFAVLLTVAVQWMALTEQGRVAARDRRQLTESYLDKGQTYCEQGDVSRGMLWFAKSLETVSPAAPDLERAIRLNLAAWRPRPALLRWAAKPGNSTDVTAAGFGDQGRIAFAVQQRTLYLYDADTGTPLGTPIKVNCPEERAVALSPDGKTVVAGTWDHGVTAWMLDAATGTSIRPLQLHPPKFAGTTPLVEEGDLGAAQRVAFSADGSVLATSDQRTVQLWNADGKPRGERMRGHTDWIEALAITVDGRRVATGSRDGTARVWEPTTGQLIGEPLPHGNTWVSGVAFSPDGQTLLTGTHSGQVRLWDIATGKSLGEPIAHSGWVWAVAYSSQGDRFLTGVGGGSNTAILWDAATRTMIGVPLVHDNYVNAVAFSPDGSRAITSSRDQSVRVWDLPGPFAVERVLRHDAPLLHVAYSPDGQLLAVGTGSADPAVWDGKVWLWDTATDKLAGEPLQHEAWVNRVVFSPDGKLVATSVDVQFKHAGPTGGPRQTDVCLWDVAARKQVCPPLVHEGEMPAIRFDEQGRLVTADTRGMVRVWDHATGQPMGPATEGKSPGVPESYSPDGRYRMLGNGEDNLGILQDLITPEAGGVIQPPNGVGASAFSRDSHFVATASASSWLWDVATRKPIGPSMGPGVTVAFSPDGRTLAVGSYEGQVRLFPVPVPVEGSVERMVLWTQVLSGAELSLPARRTLAADTWMERKQQLEQLGGAP
jgi:WD40 repeat protein